MAEAVPANATKTKWNVARENGVIEDRGLPHAMAVKRAEFFTEVERLEKEAEHDQ